jgi:tRNA-specific 2-thiouridylase
VVVDGDTGTAVGEVDAIELVTIGQRKGLGLPGGSGSPRYVTGVDIAARTVTVAGPERLLDRELRLDDVSWAAAAVTGSVLAQCSAHGTPRPASFDPSTNALTWAEPARRVAPGQAVVLYDTDQVLGGGTAS